MLVMEPNRGQDEDLPWKLRGRYIRGAPKDWACLVSDLSLVTHFRVGSSNRAIDLFGGWMFKLVIRKGVLCRRIFGYTVLKEGETLRVRLWAVTLQRSGPSMLS